MSRAPLRQPLLDQLDILALVDPEPASIAHLQRLDRRAHALATAWGGSGYWMALNMSNSEDPDEFGPFPLPLQPGVEWMRVYAFVSQRDKADPTPCEAVIASGNTATSTKLRWQEVSGGDTLTGAYVIVTADNGDDDSESGPLRVQSGVDWSWDFDAITITFDVGIGRIWGLLFQPMHQDRPA